MYLALCFMNDIGAWIQKSSQNELGSLLVMIGNSMKSIFLMLKVNKAFIQYIYQTMRGIDAKVEKQIIFPILCKK